ncbi:hypothetical protein BN7_6397 [Wickerhamomyces ciferrii]|uniref:F-box domain-containing protein n=1 Tax=Wickerhamomyces ciferrii (strain ATCC 14091 / BCRC 22168 / CBS 111 / JCM 3599 / NBRC 0793 / NRRL Y-1031 F-60-10) TaxID=1206466 RepID=K0L076_WICCF|nr:uncharacterized protein BN7_6397 [Wickerhamomyces ciferrii]CCH46798.1 hypothetical protein BN7_6397 [Wickerhamomyces ciferrii]
MKFEDLPFEIIQIIVSYLISPSDRISLHNSSSFLKKFVNLDGHTVVLALHAQPRLTVLKYGKRTRDPQTIYDGIYRGSPKTSNDSDLSECKKEVSIFERHMGQFNVIRVHWSLLFDKSGYIKKFIIPQILARTYGYSLIFEIALHFGGCYHYRKKFGLLGPSEFSTIDKCLNGIFLSAVSDFDPPDFMKGSHFRYQELPSGEYGIKTFILRDIIGLKFDQKYYPRMFIEADPPNLKTLKIICQFTY